ncbi:MAG: insulinase family protein [Oscillospiraceae bacterium]|nr:insulinase family protein [Oscillospiraceae bacterium]
MLKANRQELMPGVNLTTVRTRKFKTNLLSAQMMLPLKKDTASLNAILPKVLRRGTARYPDMESLSAALDSLYGASAAVGIRKRGEVQCIGFRSMCIDDKYALRGETLLDELTLLLCDLLLRPATRNGRFYSEYVASERDNLLRQIEAEKNEKRSYALLQLIRHMCRKEAFGVPSLGKKETASAITGKKLFTHYNQILSAAPIEFFYCGSAPEEQIASTILKGFHGLPRAKEQMTPETLLGEKANCDCDIQNPIVEEMDVAQARLAIGCRTGTAVWDELFPALMLLNAALGGTVTSKLFVNVREKLSLCYEVGTLLEKQKGLLVISAGIAPENYDLAMSEIMTQLDDARSGKFTEGELVSAKQMLISSLKGVLDSQNRLEDFYVSQLSAGLLSGPEDLVRQLDRVTPEQIREVGSRIQVDTIYFLKRREGANENKLL